MNILIRFVSVFAAVASVSASAPSKIDVSNESMMAASATVAYVNGAAPLLRGTNQKKDDQSFRLSDSGEDRRLEPTGCEDDLTYLTVDGTVWCTKFEGVWNGKQKLMNKCSKSLEFKKHCKFSCNACGSNTGNDQAYAPSAAPSVTPSKAPFEAEVEPEKTEQRRRCEDDPSFVTDDGSSICRDIEQNYSEDEFKEACAPRTEINLKCNLTCNEAKCKGMIRSGVP